MGREMLILVLILILRTKCNGKSSCTRRERGLRVGWEMFILVLTLILRIKCNSKPSCTRRERSSLRVDSALQRARQGRQNRPGDESTPLLVNRLAQLLKASPSTAHSMMPGWVFLVLTGAFQFGHGLGGFATNLIHSNFL